MRIVVVGATGNVGTSLLQSLAAEPAVDSILGIARRVPERDFPKTEWVGADIRRDALTPLFRGADVIVHLAWAIQPSRDLARVRATNVDGSARVFAAVADANVPALVYASSVGVYSPGPKEPVTEAWPTEGIRTSFYSRHKAEVERVLDRFEREHPQLRVVRLRPALTFKRESASEQRRLFAGPLLPTRLLKPGRIPFIPRHSRFRFQAVHSLDVGHAYRLACVSDVRGAFNLAADPILDGPAIARLLRTRTIPVGPRLLRTAMAITWRLRLQPSPPGWIDLAFETPLLDATRAREELGWQPRFGADETILELVHALYELAGGETPPLDPGAGGLAHVKELTTGLGARDDAT
jgi:UDP-glucose 4-epimerase